MSPIYLMKNTNNLKIARKEKGLITPPDCLENILLFTCNDRVFHLFNITLSD